MAAAFDMCVDYDTLRTIDDKLQRIEYDLQESTKKMTEAIQRSENFLAGQQFEKAKGTTMASVNQNQRTETNIKFARNYIEKLRVALEDYGKCGYLGEI